jgi:hypothetical protein
MVKLQFGRYRHPPAVLAPVLAVTTLQSLGGAALFRWIPCLICA